MLIAVSDDNSQSSRMVLKEDMDMSPPTYSSGAMTRVLVWQQRLYML